MSCGEWRQMLDDYADDQCAPAELAGLEAHLRGCSACAGEALGRIQLKRATRAAAARYEAAPEFRLRVEEMVQKAGKKGKRAWGIRLPVWMPGWAPGLSAAAVALVAAAISISIWARHTAREQELAELLDLHVATLASANPVDVISTDRHTVKPWFQGRLPFAFNLPELQDSPYRLIGGKVMYFEHNPGAQLLFEIRKHQISVFIFEDNSRGNLTGAGTVREKGFSVERWSHAGLSYVAVSDTNESDIHALGELFRAAAGP